MKDRNSPPFSSPSLTEKLTQENKSLQEEWRKCNERCAKERLRSLKKHAAPPWGLCERESGDARLWFREGCFGGDLEAAAARVRLGIFSHTCELASSVNTVPCSRVLQKERGEEERGSDSTPLTACNKLRNWGSEILVAYPSSNC